MIAFASPWWFLGLLLIAGRIALVIRDRRRAFAAFTYSSNTLVSPKTTLRARLAGLPFFLELLALTLIVVSLARPQRITTLASNERFGIDIVIALDASGSMAAEDFQPRNRFVVARELISDFIRRRNDDRIGIVTFGARAVTRVPITYDREAAYAVLERAEVGENGNGTAIGHAIATAVNRLKGSRSRSRVVILVTDGVNTSGSMEPIPAATIAAKFGVKVYTIGVGSEGTVPMPVRRINPRTGDVQIFYQNIRGEIDEATLRRIAEMTGGEYFRATDERALSQVLLRIDQLEKSRLSGPRNQKVDELYLRPLLSGLWMLLAALLLGETWMQKVSA